MENLERLSGRIGGGEYDRAFSYLYGCEERTLLAQRRRYLDLIRTFGERYGRQECALFSSPGRTEVGGNHTDHQHGRVLAAGVDLDVIAAACPNDEGIIRIKSKGYPEDVIDLRELAEKDSERGRSASLVRGIAARFMQLGLKIGGFDACTTSDVLGGSGLSSSAAFEVLVGTILSGLYNGGALDPVLIAQISQYAENVYFGKPCGLMDQTACAVGGFVTIDFDDPQKPVVEKVDFDFAHSGSRLCIVDTKGDHADLTDDYASMPAEMKSVAAQFGKEVLREVPPEEFYKGLGQIYGKVSDRAIVRAVHFYADNDRVPRQVAALREGDFPTFCRLVIESGRSSAMYLQNLFSCKDPARQGLTVALALSERLLAGKGGAWRVHGGGIAGTIQAFVPESLLNGYRAMIDGVFGAGSCHVLSIRPVGLCEVTIGLGR